MVISEFPVVLLGKVIRSFSFRQEVESNAFTHVRSGIGCSIYNNIDMRDKIVPNEVDFQRRLEYEQDIITSHRMVCKIPVPIFRNCFQSLVGVTFESKIPDKV